MNVLVGVDTEGHSNQVANLLARLRFPDLSCRLVHSVQSVMPDGSFPGSTPGATLAAVHEGLVEAGKSSLANSARVFESVGIPCTTVLDYGDPARVLLEHAEADGCEMIAVASTAKSYYGSLFFGSVAKGLILGGKGPLLITKRDHPGSGPVNAVLASDNSDYFEGCLDHLVDMGPRGLGSVTLFSVYDRDSRRVFEFASNVEADVARHHFESKSEAFAKKAGAVAEVADHLVLDGELEERLGEVVAQKRAELIVMGAQGQGFFERVTVGSSTLHQAITGKESLLLLRA